MSSISLGIVQTSGSRTILICQSPNMIFESKIQILFALRKRDVTNNKTNVRNYLTVTPFLSVLLEFDKALLTVLVEVNLCCMHNHVNEPLGRCDEK